MTKIYSNEDFPTPPEPSLQVDFRRDYKNATEAAEAALETAKRYIAAGIPGQVSAGGPALYLPEQTVLAKYGIELVVCTGCEHINFEETWCRVFTAIMAQTNLPLKGTTQGSRDVLRFESMSRWSISRDKEWQEAEFKRLDIAMDPDWKFSDYYTFAAYLDANLQGAPDGSR